jgi:hypothetical protein
MKDPTQSNLDESQLVEIITGAFFAVALIAVAVALAQCGAMH